MLALDVRRAAWEAARDAAAAGELPTMIEPGSPPADPSVLRPVRAAPGRYASTLPYLLAGPGITPGQAAAVLAARLARLPWIAGAAATAGHLSVTVTADTLAALAVRIPGAASCARSDLLRGMSFPAPPRADLAAAADWPAAHAWVTAQITGRLAAEAGAGIFPERLAPGRSPGPAARPVQDALAWAGPDAVRYALIKQVRGGPAIPAARLPVRHHPRNPAYAVRYAHAHACTTLRHAADLGLGRGEAGEFEPRLLGQPQERALLSGMSWLPERVAGAARRQRPRELARYLEELAYTYLDCRENCPALPYGGHRAPRDPGTTRARLWLVTAARTAIGAGLGLLGISAPARL